MSESCMGMSHLGDDSQGQAQDCVDGYLHHDLAHGP